MITKAVNSINSHKGNKQLQEKQTFNKETESQTKEKLCIGEIKYLQKNKLCIGEKYV